MADYTDASGRVIAYPLQGRTDDTGAEEVGEHFDGKDLASVLAAFAPGIVEPADAFRVTEDTGTNMHVLVGSGAVGDTAIVEGTATLQGNYAVVWTDAQTDIEINAADLSNPRYTSIFLIVADVQYDANSGSLVIARLATVDGTPASDPDPPAYDGDETAVLRLADILVGTGVTEITDGDIEDPRVFTGVEIAGGIRLTVDHASADETVLEAPAATPINLRQGGVTQFGVSSNGDLNANDNDLVNVGEINDVDLLDHASRHEPGGADQVVSEVDNSTEVGSQGVTSSFTVMASISLSIPGAWNSWKCEAWASYVVQDANLDGSDYEVRLAIDGNAQQAKLVENDGSGRVGNWEGAIGGRRTGMSTTGSRTIALQAREINGNVAFRDIYLYARARKTS